MKSIRERVDAVRVRQQWQWIWYCGSWGLVAGAVAGGVAAAVSRGRSEGVAWGWTAGLWLAGPLVGGLTAWLRPYRLRDAAVAIDRNCRLKDQVITALQLMARPAVDSPVHQLQLADTEQRLESVDPKQVAPIAAPRPWYWGVGITTAVLAVGVWLGRSPEPVIGASVVNPMVASQAQRVDQSLQALKELQQQKGLDAELEKMLQQITKTVDELQQPGVDPKEALAKLSEIEGALQTQQQQLIEASNEATLRSVGEALSLAETLAEAGEALEQGELDKAAEELAKAELPEVPRQVEKSLVEKLERAGKEAAERRAVKLGDALGKLSQGLSQKSNAQFQEGAKALAAECQQEGQRKKLVELLRQQGQCLAECKSQCEGALQVAGSLVAQSTMAAKSKEWGTGASGNDKGPTTAQLESDRRLTLKGQQTEQGESEVQTVSSTAEEQAAARQYREQVEKYQQLSESVLDAEPIPLGHRQTIRRYFELIRPQDVDTN